MNLALMAAAELAKGIIYKNSIVTGWVVLSFVPLKALNFQIILKLHYFISPIFSFEHLVFYVLCLADLTFLYLYLFCYISLQQHSSVESHL